jgi:hypothetical protein
VYYVYSLENISPRRLTTDSSVVLSRAARDSSACEH